MIHNMGQFTQRLSKNSVCCFLPWHNVTSENRRDRARAGNLTIGSGGGQIAWRTCAPRRPATTPTARRPMTATRPPQINWTSIVERLGARLWCRGCRFFCDRHEIAKEWPQSRNRMSTCPVGNATGRAADRRWALSLFLRHV